MIFAIIDHNLPENTSYSNNPECFNIGLQEFSLKDKHPSLDSVNIKILRELVMKDKLDSDSIQDYMGYLIKIASLSQSF